MVIALVRMNKRLVAAWKLEHIPSGVNRFWGFPFGDGYDSRCWLEKQASMDGKEPLERPSCACCGSGAGGIVSSASGLAANHRTHHLQ